jgi:membrane-associated phospholipid phosphatase
MHVSSRGSLRALVVTLTWVAAYAAICITHYEARGFADNLGRPTYSPGTIDHALIGRSAAVWLQHLLPDRGVMPLVIVALYASWFIALIVLQAVVLARSGPRALLELLALHVAVLVIADVIFVLWPTRPPWMDLGATRVIAGAGANPHNVPDNNPFAAFPSLHVATPFLYAIWFARRDDAWLRRIAPAIGVWTLAIAFAVVYGAEHYLTDVAAGALCAVVVCAAGCWATAALATPARRVRIALPQQRATSEAVRA